MFEILTGRIARVFAQLRRRGRLGEADVDVTLREIRLALLDADVQFGVVKQLLDRVREKAVGERVARALNPAEQVITIVYEELVLTLGEAVPLSLSGPRPRVLVLAGLNGSGKTTTAAKLARILKTSGERVMLVAADPYRPAAAEQLRLLGHQIGVDVYLESDVPPVELLKEAHRRAGDGGYGSLVVDTAGRSQIDSELMDEIAAITRAVPPSETLLVLDAMTGQEAIQIAEGFRKRIDLTGLVLTKLDGDARGGAAISIRAVTGLPLKFIGTGEGLDALQMFDPRRLASRILGMGDIAGLIETAKRAADENRDASDPARMLEGSFDLESWLGQLRQLRKMGPIGQLMDMLPPRLRPTAALTDAVDVERELQRTEAIISSMTPAERRDPELLDASRRRRVAAGSGTDVQSVNRLIRQFREGRRLLKELRGSGPALNSRFRGQRT